MKFSCQIYLNKKYILEIFIFHFLKFKLEEKFTRNKRKLDKII